MMEALKSLWWLMINVGYLIIILLLAWMLFTVPAQADDFVYVFVQDGEITYILWVALFLALWCYVTWYSACIILQIDPIETLDDAAVKDRILNSSHQRLTIEIPRILGIVPCLIVASAIWFVPEKTHLHQFYYLAGLLALGILMYRLFVYQDRNAERPNVVNHLASSKYKPSYSSKAGFSSIGDLYQMAVAPTQFRWPTNQEVVEFRKINGNGRIPTIRQEIQFILQYASVRFYYIFFGIVSIVLLFVFSVPFLNLWISTAIRPASVLIVSVTFITFFLTIVIFFHDYASRPFGVIVLLWLLFCSVFNDNTVPDYKADLNGDHRLSTGEAFDQWVLARKSEWPDSTPIPVIFIAAQGGGTRGLNWTARILDTLSKRYPNKGRSFYRQIFAISGVSGGGVGSTFYTAYRRRADIDAQSDKCFKTFATSDFLSPVTAAFTFGDGLQKVWFLPIPFLERSKILGQTWDWQYARAMEERPDPTVGLDQSFLNLWYNKANKMSLDHPSLFINGTLSENGQRVITSNLRLDGEWFKDDLDYFSRSGHDISVSTAALNCSRFPFITSGALLESRDGNLGHIIDGGYRENSGLQTINNIYFTVKDRFDRDQQLLPIFIYLKNGLDELDPSPKATRLLHDLATPVLGLFNVNGTGMPAKGMQQSFRQSFGPSQFFVVDLENRDTSNVKLPLGWYMSQTVSDEIDKRVRSMSKYDRDLLKRLDVLFAPR